MGSEARGGQRGSTLDGGEPWGGWEEIAGGSRWGVNRGGGCTGGELREGDHIPVRLRGISGVGECVEGGADGGADNGGKAPAAVLEQMMEMMRLKGEQLQLLAASTSRLRAEVEDLRKGRAEEKKIDPSTVPVHPLSLQNVEALE